MDLFSLSNDIQTAIPTVMAYPESGKTVRVDIAQNNVALRKKVTDQVIALFPGSLVTKTRPNDVMLPGGWKVLVKPAQGAKKTGSIQFFWHLVRVSPTPSNHQEA